MEEGRVHGGQSIEVLLRHGACLPVRVEALNASVSGWALRATHVCAPHERRPAMLAAMSVRVLVVALVVQVLLVGAFIVWAASGFPLP